MMYVFQSPIFPSIMREASPQALFQSVVYQQSASSKRRQNKKQETRKKAIDFDSYIHTVNEYYAMQTCINNIKRLGRNKQFIRRKGEEGEDHHEEKEQEREQERITHTQTHTRKVRALNQPTTHHQEHGKQNRT